MENELTYEPLYAIANDEDNLAPNITIAYIDASTARLRYRPSSVLKARPDKALAAVAQQIRSASWASEVQQEGTLYITMPAGYVVMASLALLGVAFEQISEATDPPGPLAQPVCHCECC